MEQELKFIDTINRALAERRSSATPSTAGFACARIALD